MGNWFPQMYDVIMKPLESKFLNKIRSSVVNRAKGRVLEVGSGTGVNFPFYKNATRVDAIEPNPLMIERGQIKAKSSRVPIVIHQEKAEALPFSNDTFDSVVATLVFCTIPNPKKAIEEIKRVSKTGAKILLLEHVKMNQSFLAKTQDILTPLWKRICDGCHLNRDTLKLLDESGLTIRNVTNYCGGLFLSIELRKEPNNKQKRSEN